MADNSDLKTMLILGIILGLLIGILILTLIDLHNLHNPPINQVAIKPQAQDINAIQHKWETQIEGYELEIINLNCNELSLNTLQRLEYDLRGNTTISCDLAIEGNKAIVLYNNGVMISKHECAIFDNSMVNYSTLQKFDECFAIDNVYMWEVDIVKKEKIY